MSSRCSSIYGGTQLDLRYLFGRSRKYFYDKVDRMAEKGEFLIHLLIKRLS